MVKKEEKTTLELMEEKEVMIKEYDLLIYESSQRSVAKSMREGERLRAERKRYEDDGWNSSYINPTQPEPEPEPKPKAKPKHVHKKVEEPEVDPKELEIARLKALLAEKEAAVIEETIEEVVLETTAELAEEEDTIKEDGE